MKLQEFKEDLYSRIKVYAQEVETTDREAFVSIVTDILTDAEEIEDFEYLPFEGLGAHNRKIAIDGYAYNELDEYRSLFIVPTLSYTEKKTLTNSEAMTILARAQAFIEEISHILQHAEESSPGYGLAIDIKNDLLEEPKPKKFIIYLLTDMEMSSRIKQLDPGSIDGIPIEYHIWDISRLHQIEESAEGKEDIVIDFAEFGLEKGLPCLPASQTDEYSAYLCNIPGIILSNLYNTHGGRLLEGNVRSFLQIRGKVNKGIRATILTEPNMFFAYNNGIAATAKELKTTLVNGILHINEITALQIVNGGQTTASLAMAFLNDKRENAQEKIKQIFV